VIGSPVTTLPFTLASYQDAFKTPGRYPALAFWRKQIRHSWNFRRTLLARPQMRQRRTFRVMNFGFRCDLMIIALLAIDSFPSASKRHAEAFE
jgi:hypothetical protein